MAEAWKYRREDVLDENGNVVDTALFRIPNARGEGGRIVGGSASGSGDAWSNAEYRGASAGGRVRQYIRSAAGRMAARNPAERYGRYSRANNRYGI